MVEQENEIDEIIVEDGFRNQRIDSYLSIRLQDLSRTKIQKLISAGQILLNGKECSTKAKVSSGDKIEISGSLDSFFQSESYTLKPVKIDFQILYEDEHLIVINKPAGLVVHPGAGTRDPTLVDGLLYHYKNSSEFIEKFDDGSGTNLRPGIVHRLDKDTTGAIVCAKTSKVAEGLAKQFFEKSNLREYVALLDGVMKEPENIIESYLYRDPRNRQRFASMSKEEFQSVDEEKTGSYKYAKSQFSKKKVYNERLTLATIKLYTGRTHQIRVHARKLKMPVIGDQVYNSTINLPNNFPDPIKNVLRGLKRQMLHARLLGFKHPITGKMMGFEAPLPDDFRKIINLLEGN